MGIQYDLIGTVYSGEWIKGLKEGEGVLDFGDGTSYQGKFIGGLAVEGIYDWGDGKYTDSYQNENGEWLDK